VHDIYMLTGAQPAMLSHEEWDPVPRVVHDAFFNGTRGVRHMWWDSANQDMTVDLGCSSSSGGVLAPATN
jgi:hypothetical protein